MDEAAGANTIAGTIFTVILLFFRIEKLDMNCVTGREATLGPSSKFGLNLFSFHKGITQRAADHLARARPVRLRDSASMPLRGPA